MLTPQEVANKSFTKSMMGGYSMPMVDEFLDELTEDYSSLYKENAALKAKLKVLVDKVEEYRSTEDNMRTALYTAQKMANDIVEDARQKSATITANAEEEARVEILKIRENVESERRHLTDAQRDMSRFIAQWKDIVARQAEFLVSLPELPDPEEEEEAPSAEQSVSENGVPTDAGIEQTIQNILKNTAAAKPSETPKAVEEAAPPVAATEERVPSTEELNELFGTRTFHLDELKFGKNYEAEK